MANEPIAQGIALGDIALPTVAPRRGKSNARGPLLLPLRGATVNMFPFPRALPWATCLLPLRGAPPANACGGCPAAVADIVQVLTDTVDPRDYLKKMLRRDPELKSRWGTICTPTRMIAADGKVYKTQAADLEGIFRIIQSIPSKKAEPVKRWLAEVGTQRIDQMIDPELIFQMAVEDYRRQGYSDLWINERMRSIEMRKELTDEWHRSGIHEPKDFAILTNVLTKAWSGMTTGEYKRHKGLTKENLRDNMTNVELALNTLAEVTTTELSRQRNPKGMAQSRNPHRTITAGTSPRCPGGSSIYSPLQSERGWG